MKKLSICLLALLLMLPFATLAEEAEEMPTVPMTIEELGLSFEVPEGLELSETQGESKADFVATLTMAQDPTFQITLRAVDTGGILIDESLDSDAFNQLMVGLGLSEDDYDVYVYRHFGTTAVSMDQAKKSLGFEKKDGTEIRYMESREDGTVYEYTLFAQDGVTEEQKQIMKQVTGSLIRPF